MAFSPSTGVRPSADDEKTRQSGMIAGIVIAIIAVFGGGIFALVCLIRWWNNKQKQKNINKSRREKLVPLDGEFESSKESSDKKTEKRTKKAKAVDVKGKGKKKEEIKRKKTEDRKRKPEKQLGDYLPRGIGPDVKVKMSKLPPSKDASFYLDMPDEEFLIKYYGRDRFERGDRFTPTEIRRLKEAMVYEQCAAPADQDELAIPDLPVNHPPKELEAREIRERRRAEKLRAAQDARRLAALKAAEADEGDEKKDEKSRPMQSDHLSGKNAAADARTDATGKSATESRGAAIDKRSSKRERPVAESGNKETKQSGNVVQSDKKDKVVVDGGKDEQEKAKTDKEEAVPRNSDDKNVVATEMAKNNINVGSNIPVSHNTDKKPVVEVADKVKKSDKDKQNDTTNTGKDSDTKNKAPQLVQRKQLVQDKDRDKKTTNRGAEDGSLLASKDMQLTSSKKGPLQTPSRKQKERNNTLDGIPELDPDVDNDIAPNGSAPGKEGLDFSTNQTQIDSS